MDWVKMCCRSDFLELFARCGVIPQIYSLKSTYAHVLSLVDDSLDTMIYNDRHKDYGWSPYFGIALEENWRERINV